MSDSTVRLQIKITGENSIKNVEMSADQLRSAIEQVKNEADKLNSSLINSNQIAQAFEQVGSAVQGLQSVMHELTDAYAVQAQAEARLATVMRNTMDATEDEIQSIKDLASAQQELGVVGDEVQLSGAQELATYLGKKESLEKLIPVMNDMIAQQYGYNATAESAVGIATMMGKVMEGQTKALSRYGYSFTEAQEEILKFGTEEERAATLAEVIEQSVGGVNAALAATPYGKIVQANNKFGDLKETLGSLVAPAMTVVDNIARITIAIAGIGKGIATIKSLTTSIKALGIHSKVTAAAQRMLGAAGITAAAGTTALRVAVAALYATMTLGLSLAIHGVITLITNLTGSARDAAKGMDELNEANEAYKNAAGQAKAEIETEIAALKRLMEQEQDTADAVRHLNAKYGEIFGSHQTASEWYDILTQKSELYCRQLGYEAKAKKLAAEIGEKIVERDRLKEQLAVTPEKRTVHGGYMYGTWSYEEDNPAYTSLSDSIASLDSEIESMTTAMNSAFGEAGKAADELNGKVNDGTEAVSWQKMGYVDLGKAIEEQEKKWKGLIGIDNETAKSEKAIWDAMRLRYDQMGKAFGLAKKNVKELNDEIRREPVDLIPELQPIVATSVERTPVPTTEAGFDKWIDALQTNLKNTTADMRPAIDAEIARAKKLRDEFLGVKDAVGEVNQTVSASPMDTFTKAWSGIKGVGSSIRSIKDAITETDNAWDALTQTVDGFISLFQSFTSIIEIIRNITAVTKALTEQKKQETAQTVEGNAEEAASELGKAGAKVAASNMAAAAKKNEATANAEAAATGAASSVASIPLVGAVMAVAAVASVIAALANLPKFASGAVVYGPTLGLMGEYAGASSNPEVIAPLSKLQGLIGGQQGRSEVKFRIEGRELVGILNKQTNIYQRNG